MLKEPWRTYVFEEGLRAGWAVTVRTRDRPFGRVCLSGDSLSSHQGEGLICAIGDVERTFVFQESPRRLGRQVENLL